MDLNHTFTVPADKATAWAAFEDIASVAECFPGASVTSVEGDEFKGTCKVKLGPIALQYSGQGSFVERDADAGRLVFDARGRDKRGNGTAGAKVTATFHEEAADSTRVEVHTDMQITGKPAQFGRGVIQDVSDKLLEQFVGCLQQKVGTAPAAESEGAAPQVDPAAPVPGPTDEPAVPPAAGASPASVAGGPAAGTAPRAATSASNGASVSRPASSSAGSDDALNLGATVVPILLKSYGKQIGAALAALLVLRWLVRRRR